MDSLDWRFYWIIDLLPVRINFVISHLTSDDRVPRSSGQYESDERGLRSSEVGGVDERRLRSSEVWEALSGNASANG